MAMLMERIIRPHLPDDSAPKKTAPKCREEEKNKVAKFAAPPGQMDPPSTPTSSGGDGGSPSEQPEAPKPQETERTSSWSYAYKKYMTKKEKEQEKCDPSERIVTAGTQATDKPAPEQEQQSGG